MEGALVERPGGAGAERLPALPDRSIPPRSQSARSPYTAAHTGWLPDRGGGLDGEGSMLELFLGLDFQARRVITERCMADLSAQARAFWD